MFAPVELNEQFKGPRVAINPADPLRLVGAGWEGQPVLVVRGMEVREASGERGFFEITCVRGAGYGHIRIGLATHGVDLTRGLGFASGGCAWCSGGGDGYLYSNLPGIPDVESAALGFTDGDRIGLLVDCTAAPTLRFFKNGAQVDEVIFTAEIHGEIVYPAFGLYTAEIDIASNPALPSAGPG